MYHFANEEDKSISYDFLSIIRKINKGIVTSKTLLYTNDDEKPKLAGEFEEFSSHFKEVEASLTASNAELKVKQSAKNAIAFVIENIMSVPMVAGVFLLASILFIMLGAYTPFKEPIAIFACAISYVMLVGFSMYIMQKTHGRAIDIGKIIAGLKENILHTLVVGLLISVPLIVVTFFVNYFAQNHFITVPIVALVLYAELFFTTFVPFLIIEKKMDFLDALKTSAKTVLGLKKNDILMIAVLNGAIILGGLIIVLPLLFVLPAVYFAFSETYESIFPAEDETF